MRYHGRDAVRSRNGADPSARQPAPRQNGPQLGNPRSHGIRTIRRALSDRGVARARLAPHAPAPQGHQSRIASGHLPAEPQPELRRAEAIAPAPEHLQPAAKQHDWKSYHCVRKRTYLYNSVSALPPLVAPSRTRHQQQGPASIASPPSPHTAVIRACFSLTFFHAGRASVRQRAFRSITKGSLLRMLANI